MVFTLIPAVTEAALAAGQASVKFIVRDVNDDGDVTEITAYCDDYINLSSLGDSESLKGGNWYVSKSGYKLFSSRVSIEGNDSVNIILTDDSEVEFMKTYYLRVRTFKTVSGVTYYSNWSTIKRIKTK